MNNITGDLSLNRGPIFIGGAERSGKTYMRLMLSCHPNLAVTRRTNMWPRYYNKFGDLSQEGNFENCLAAMMTNKHILALEPDAARIREEFRQGSPSYGRLFEIIHIHFMQRAGKRRWGDQTEMIERFADLILSAYPTARIIHMIRDPRDRFEATLTKKPIHVGEATAKWLYSAALAERNQQKYPDRYKVVRYESMVAHPQVLLDDICSFLQELYHPSMLSMEGVPRFRSTKDAEDRSTESPLSVEYIGRYQQFLSGRDIAFIQRYAGRAMRKYKYPLSPRPLLPWESIHYFLLDWPVFFGRMAAWFLLKRSA